MSVQTLDTRKAKKAGAAPLKNMLLLDTLMKQAIERPDHLPGICGFSGPSGFGKSTAAAWVAGKYQANYLEVRSLWTKRSFLEHLVRLQDGMVPARTAAELLDQAVTGMIRSGLPLIIDEFDNAVDRGLVEVVRDIHEQTKTPVIIIGEERLPQKLKRWERFDGRVLNWVQARPADLADVMELADHYMPGVKIEDDLAELLAKTAKGSVRRIVVNLDHIGRFARGSKLASVGVSEWGDRALYSGTTIKVREFI